MLALLSLLAFAAVVLLVYGLGEPAAALAEVRGAPPLRNALTESPAGPLVRFLAPLHRGPRLAGTVSKLEQKLLEAGRPGGLASGAELLAGVELVALAGFLGMLGLYASVGGVTVFGLVFSLAVGAFAGWIPLLLLDGRVEDRRRDVASQLPYFLDLAVMTMESGATFIETIEIFVRDNPGTTFSEELALVQGEIRMGKSTEEALEGMLSRFEVDDLTYTVNAILQGQRMGTPLGQILRDQSDVMRFRRSQRAERMAEELKVRIQGPTMLMMIAVFLLILGPAFIKVLTSGIF